MSCPTPGSETNWQSPPHTCPKRSPLFPPLVICQTPHAHTHSFAQHQMATQAPPLLLDSTGRPVMPPSYPTHHFTRCCSAPTPPCTSSSLLVPQPQPHLHPLLFSLSTPLLPVRPRLRQEDLPQTQPHREGSLLLCLRAGGQEAPPPRRSHHQAFHRSLRAGRVGRRREARLRQHGVRSHVRLHALLPRRRPALKVRPRPRGGAAAGRRGATAAAPRGRRGRRRLRSKEDLTKGGHAGHGGEAVSGDARTRA